MGTLVAVGINHKTAPINLRERLAFTPAQLAQSLPSLIEIPTIKEATILSTCNRTELYCHAEEADTPIHWLSKHKHLAQQELQPHLYIYREEIALKHILRVATGLDSMLLGEPQILGQLKSAVAAAQQYGAVGNYLEGLFQHIFAVSKRIRTTTGIGVSPISLAYSTVHLAKRIFADILSMQVLLLGAGETIELMARYLQHQVAGLTFVNRTLAKAQQLADCFQGEAFPLHLLPEVLPQVDIVIAATASELPLIGKGMAEKAIKKRRHRPILMVDLAVPRDIEKEVSELADVYLYNIDDMQTIIEQGLAQRRQAAEAAEALIEQEVQHYFKQQKAIQLTKTVVTCYREQAERARDHLVERAMHQLARGKSPEAIIKELAHRLTNQLIHSPSVGLRQAGYDGHIAQLEWAKKLLGIEKHS